MSGRRLNPLRMSSGRSDFLEKFLLAGLCGATLAGTVLLGLVSISENDPRKKQRTLVAQVENNGVGGLFDIDLMQCRLEWVEIMKGIKIGGEPLMKSEPGALTLDEYLRQKQEIKRTGQPK
mmetsp:Transcript_3720/g.5462  ORF Transcript_3720/g.5462 Transcript_3720/m.5462 type:complete len:121 (+) Transcript_3720:88-450(+)